MAGEMRHNPNEPRRAICPRCREIVLVVVIAERRVPVDLELQLEREQPPEPGLYVGLAGDGSTKPLRLPSRARLTGISLHIPHERSCRGRADG